MQAGLALICALGACGPEDGQKLLKEAATLGVDPISVLRARLRLDENVVFERAARWAGLVYARTVPDPRRFDCTQVALEEIGQTRALKMRLFDRDVVFISPDFAQLLALKPRIEADPEARRRWCVAPPRRLRLALVECHSDTLVGFARDNLLPKWKLATARLPGGLRVGFIVALLALLAAAVAAPFEARPMLVPLLFVLLGLPSVLRVLAIIDWWRLRKHEQGPLARDADLPVYSVMIPLRDEAQMVPQLLAVISGLDYPHEKLDVKFIVEADNPETVATVAKGIAGTGYELVSVPHAAPFTKPKALNFALPLVRGDCVVVYDAEDQPEPDQLRRTATRFLAEPDLGCIQAELVPDNANENVFTALFAGEYGGQFGVMLPELAHRGFPMPLGGTSNHFRTSVLRRIGGWDAYNVTEDADLGVRLARLRILTDTITSRTYEEAPVTAGAWFRQRTRWMKGWMQTYLVHNRRPGQLLRDLGLRNFLVFEIYVSGMILTSPLHTLYMLAIAVNLVLGRPPPTEFYLWSFIEIFTLIAGYISAAGVSVAGLIRLGRARIVVYQLLLPFYWAAMGMASFRAAYELIAKPYYWSKTGHGVSPMSHPPGGLVRRHREKAKTEKENWSG